MTEQTFYRRENRTEIRETFWTFMGMRSLNACYFDGLHHVSFITNKDSDRRQTTVNVHETADFTINSDDSNALIMTFRSNDGTPLSFSVFDITLSHLADAVADAIARQSSTKEVTQ
jgi:hypothetical protein